MEQNIWQSEKDESLCLVFSPSMPSFPWKPEGWNDLVEQFQHSGLYFFHTTFNLENGCYLMIHSEKPESQHLCLEGDSRNPLKERGMISLVGY